MSNKSEKYLKDIASTLKSIEKELKRINKGSSIKLYTTENIENIPSIMPTVEKR